LRKGENLTKNYLVIALAALLIMSVSPTAIAAGIFGPPQTTSREAGGLNTAVGYWYHEESLKNGLEHIFRKNQVYSQVSYGSKNIWEIYGRIGVADLTISDAFSSTNAATITANSDFTENWKFFGSLGAKGFLPINRMFGIGAFVSGTYYFNNFTSDVTGTNAGPPFAADLKVHNMWDVNFGIGFQAAILYGVKLYAGPYIYYSEAKACLSANIPGLAFGTENVLLKNKTIAGGFAGADIPLGKGFHMNIEGQYSEQFSCGAAISYTY
jgi:hypothetical protein